MLMPTTYFETYKKTRWVTHKWTDRRADTDVLKQNQKTANCRTSLSHIWFSLCYSSHFTTLNFYIFEYFHSKMLVKVVIKLNNTNKCISMKKKLEKDPFCYKHSILPAVNIFSLLSCGKELVINPSLTSPFASTSFPFLPRPRPCLSAFCSPFLPPWGFYNFYFHTNLQTKLSNSPAMYYRSPNNGVLLSGWWDSIAT